MPSPFDCRLGPIWNPDVVVGESNPAVCASRIVAVDNRVRVVNVAEVRSVPMGSATEAWDDSGTARSVASDPTSAASPLFVLDETVDNVGIAMQPLAAGDVVSFGGTSLKVRTAVPARHKIALVDIDAGETVRKLGHTIGIATIGIAAGEHVHVHNLAVPLAQRPASSRAGETRDAWRPGVDS